MEINKKEFVICRTDCSLNNFKSIADINGSISYSTLIHGYDSKFYFELNGEYTFFDFNSYELNAIEPGSEEELIVSSGAIFYQTHCGFLKGKCSRKGKSCFYDVEGTSYCFEETTINPRIYELMNKFKFKPLNYFFSTSGDVCLLYYANMNFGGLYDCLAVSYNVNNNQILEYQIFSTVSTLRFNLYPVIRL